MKMIPAKKTAASLLALGLTTATLAACGQTAATTTAKPAETKAGETAKATDKADPSQGKGDANVPFKETVEFKVMSPIWGDHEKSLNDKKSNAVLDELMKKTNTKITYDFYPQDNYANRVTTTLASNEIPEVINGAMTALVNEGAAAPIDEALAKYGKNILRAYENNPVEATKLRSVADGKTYAIPFALLYPQAYSWSIREDWLKKAGFDKAPQTWEELNKVWEAWKGKDMNGDGNPTNDVPYGGDIYSLMPLFGMNVANKHGFMIDDKGKYTLAEETENFRPFLEEMRRLYDAKILDPEFAQRGNYVDGKKLSDGINAGLIGTTFTWAEITRTATKAYKSVNPEAKLVGMAPPAGPQGKKGIPSRPLISGTSSITIAAEKKGMVDKIIQYYDFVFSDEGTRISSYGVEGVHYDMKDNKPVLKPEYSEGFAKARAAGLNFTPLAHNFDPAAYEQIMLQGKTLAEVDPETKIFHDALYMGEKDFFSQTPVLNTAAHIKYAADLLPQLGNALAECVAGNKSIDEFYAQYESLKKSGLQEILDEGDKAWQAMQKK